jgi:uncharacterized iron-regulated protein
MAVYKRNLFALCAALAAAACAIQPAAQLAVNAPPTVWLMGEVHDNPQAHQARYDLIASKVKAGWRPAIVMEQFDREHQGLLRTAQDECKTAACITSKPWVEKWQWEFYEPIIQLALDYQLPLLAANVSRDDANRIVKGGYGAALDPDTIAQYALNKPLPKALAEQHRQNIVEGHCNMLPPQVAEKMIPAQVARDVWMAKVIEQQAIQRDVVLIAGNGHVQKDVGVEQWLPAELQQTTTVYGFIENSQTAGSAQFDVLARVPAHNREDPCEAFKAMMKK